MLWMGSPGLSALLLLLLGLLPAAASAELWQWTDEDGTVRYSPRQSRIPAGRRGSALVVEPGMPLPPPSAAPAAGAHTIYAPPDDVAFEADPFNAPSQAVSLEAEELSPAPPPAVVPEPPAYESPAPGAALAPEAGEPTPAVATAAPPVDETSAPARVGTPGVEEPTPRPEETTAPLATAATPQIPQATPASPQAAPPIPQAAAATPQATPPNPQAAAQTPPVAAAPEASSPSTAATPPVETAAVSAAATPSEPAALDLTPAEARTRRNEVEAQIADDEDRLKELISSGSTDDIESSSELHEIARRLPKLQAELRQLEHAAEAGQ
jgi:hypothetical protein